MKKLICTSLATGLIFSCSVFAAQVTSTAGAGAQTTVSPVMPRNGVTPPAQSGMPIRNGVVGHGAAQGTTPGSFTTVSNPPTAFTNFAGTNGLNGTNNFAATNGLGTNGVTAIVTPMTNFPVAVNSNFDGNVVIQDQATTPSDRVLLTTLSQGVRATLGITPNGNTPVHFLIQNGTVTVVGTVQSSAQSQAVLAQVQQTPGVLSVIDDMHVSGPFAPANVQNGANRSFLLGAPTDRAFSAADQRLLTTVQQEAALQLGVTSTQQMPVHFSIENGVVGVTGQVSSLQEKQALIAAIGRTPGIVRVVDNVSVTAGGNVGFTGGNTGTLTPTSRSTNQLINTNSSGF